LAKIEIQDRVQIDQIFVVQLTLSNVQLSHATMRLDSTDKPAIIAHPEILRTNLSMQQKNVSIFHFVYTWENNRDKWLLIGKAAVLQN
jgi:hypothetical protein